MFFRKSKVTIDEYKKQVEALTGTVEWNNYLRNQIVEARFHLRNHLKDMDAKELECIHMDDLIRASELPEEYLISDDLKEWAKKD